MEAGEVEPTCDVCTKQLPKYTCPACDKRTCSLECVKSHKETDGCTGKRPSTTFIPISGMDDDSITLDAQLIARLQSESSRAAQLEPPRQDGKSLGRQGSFRWMLAERRLLVKCLPSDFSRHKGNKSRIQRTGETRKVFWTVEIRDKDNIRLVHGIDETVPIKEALLPDFDLEGRTVNLLDEGSKANGRLKPIDPLLPLSSVLQDITIIEYPIIIIT